MKLILSIVFTLFVSSAVGEVIKHAECRDVGKDHNLQFKYWRLFFLNKFETDNYKKEVNF